MKSQAFNHLKHRLTVINLQNLLCYNIKTWSQYEGCVPTLVFKVHESTWSSSSATLMTCLLLWESNQTQHFCSNYVINVYRVVFSCRESSCASSKIDSCLLATIHNCLMSSADTNDFYYFSPWQNLSISGFLLQRQQPTMKWKWQSGAVGCFFFFFSFPEATHPPASCQ